MTSGRRYSVQRRCIVALVSCFASMMPGGCVGSTWTEQQGRKPGEFGHYRLREFKIAEKPDRKMSYEVFGERCHASDGPNPDLPVLLFLHGVGGSKYFWSQLAILMTGQHGYRSVLVDLPGHGMSDKPLDISYSAEAQGQRLKPFVEYLASEYHSKVVLVGESYGAATALEIAKACCESGVANPIAGLFVCDPPAYYFWQLEDPPKRLCMLKKGLRNPVLTSLASDYVFEWQNLEWAVWDESKIKEHDRIEVRRQYASNKARLALVKVTVDMIEGLKSRKADKNDARRYSCIDRPVRIIWGEKDRIVPIDVMATLYRDLTTTPGRSVSCRIIQDCGHDALRECPSELADELIWFLHDDLHEPIRPPLRPRTQSSCHDASSVIDADARRSLPLAEIRR